MTRELVCIVGVLIEGVGAALVRLSGLPTERDTERAECAARTARAALEEMLREREAFVEENASLRKQLDAPAWSAAPLSIAKSS